MKVNTEDSSEEDISVDVCWSIYMFPEVVDGNLTEDGQFGSRFYNQHLKDNYYAFLRNSIF